MFSLIKPSFTRPRLPQAGFAFFDYTRPAIFAHRGGGGCWPENTLYAFERAAALGVDGFEMDIHRTRDGHIVVSHDGAVDRCCDGDGDIKDLSLEQVQAQDAGYTWSNDEGRTHPFRGQGIRVPALREIFERFPDKRYIIDCKPPKPDVALDLAKLVIDCGMEGRVCLASFHLDNVLTIRKHYPQLVTSCSSDEVHFFWAAQFFRFDGFYRNAALALQVPASQYGIPFLTRRFIRVAHAHHMHVHIWTIDDPDEMRHLLSMDVDGIITDFPELALRVAGRLP